MTATLHALCHAIDQVGLIAVLNTDFGVDELLEISDALLAAPVLALAIDATVLDAADVVSAIRARHGTHLVVGLTGIANRTARGAAGLNNAQFAFLPLALCDPPESGGKLLQIPVINDMAEAQMPAASGHRVILLNATEQTEPAAVAAYRQAHPEHQLLIGGEAGYRHRQNFAAAGAAALCVGETHVAAHSWSSRALITHLRRLRNEWIDGQKTGKLG